MTTITGSALATVQAKRFSARSQGNMRRRGGGPTLLVSVVVELVYINKCMVMELEMG